MNIFIMILVALFMAGYYIMDSPNQKIPEQETEYAIEKSNLRMIAQCATAVHNAQIKGTEFDDIWNAFVRYARARKILDKNFVGCSCYANVYFASVFYHMCVAIANRPHVENFIDVASVVSLWSDVGSAC